MNALCPLFAFHGCKSLSPLPANTPYRTIKDSPSLFSAGPKTTSWRTGRRPWPLPSALNSLHMYSRLSQALCHPALQFWGRAPEVQKILEKSSRQTCQVSSMGEHTERHVGPLLKCIICDSTSLLSSGSHIRLWAWRGGGKLQLPVSFMEV